MLRYCFLIVGCIILVWGQALCAQDPVYFPDPNLQAAIEDTLWISDPTPADLLGLTELRAVDKEISDLTGLEHAVNLQTLFLRDNLVSDISVLSVLSHYLSSQRKKDNN